MPDEHEHPFTIAIDVGGTGLKADVLDKDGGGRGGTGAGAHDLSHATPRVGPHADQARGQAARGGQGVVRLPWHGPPGPRAQRAALRPGEGPGLQGRLQLFADWSDFDLAAALSKSIGKPCRVANDADVQGLAVVQGKGFEAVITLGTGFGTAFFMDGSLMPHLEFSHLEFRKGETFNEQSARRHARRPATRAGTSGSARPSPTSMRCASSTTSTSAAATPAGSTGATWATCSSASPWWTTAPASSVASSSGRVEHVGVEGGPQ